MTATDPEAGLPAEFLQRLEALLPSPRLETWRRAFRSAPVAAFRANTLLAEEAQVIDELRSAGLEAAELGWPAGVWVVPPTQRRTLTDSKAAREGRVWVQNPSSVVPVALLDPQPGEEVLDLAAAPGGKAVHLAARMDNRGRLAAVESVKGRFHRLRRNLERCGVRMADTYLADGAGIGRKVPERFDRILLDAPCSSEGRFHAEDPTSYRYWGRKKIRDMARKQKRLAISAVQALKPGGVLVYCTCTMAPEENESIVDALLSRYEGRLEVELLDLPSAFVLPGLAEWEGRSYDAAVRRCARLAPDEQREAFFVARLRKLESTETAP
jgi:16S rRNA (cytosine1407-C5)-methyltransferase